MGLGLLYPIKRCRDESRGIFSFWLCSRPEDDAGSGAVGVKFAFLANNFSFSRSGAAANVNDVCFATDQARVRFVIFFECPETS